jgi:hypothetical protein
MGLGFLFRVLIGAGLVGVSLRRFELIFYPRFWLGQVVSGFCPILSEFSDCYEDWASFSLSDVLLVQISGGFCPMF